MFSYYIGQWLVNGIKLLPRQNTFHVNLYGKFNVDCK